MSWRTAHIFFCAVQDSSPEIGAPHIHGESSHINELNLDNPSEMPRSVSVLHDFRSC